MSAFDICVVCRGPLWSGAVCCDACLQSLTRPQTGCYKNPEFPPPPPSKPGPRIPLHELFATWCYPLVQEKCRSAFFHNPCREEITAEALWFAWELFCKPPIPRKASPLEKRAILRDYRNNPDKRARMAAWRAIKRARAGKYLNLATRTTRDYPTTQHWGRPEKTDAFDAPAPMSMVQEIQASLNAEQSGYDAYGAPSEEGSLKAHARSRRFQDRREMREVECPEELRFPIA